MKPISIILASTFVLCAYTPLEALAQTDSAPPPDSAKAPPAPPAATASPAQSSPSVTPAPSAATAPPPGSAPEPPGAPPPEPPPPPAAGGAPTGFLGVPVQAGMKNERRYTFWGAEPGRPADELDYAVSPAIPIRFSAYSWMDAGYMKQTNKQAGSYDKDYTYAQGRVVFGMSYRRDMGPLFAEARAQFIAFDNEYTKSQYEPHTLDAFVRVGGRIWDVQIGRFLGWEPYYRGNGIDRYTAEESGALNGPSMYRLDYTLGYANEAGQAALHLYPTDWLAFELGSLYGQESSQNTRGVRPVVALRRFGFLLTGGWEYAMQTPQDDSTKVKQRESGAAGRLAYTLAGTTIGVDLSHVKVDAWQLDGQVNAASSFDKTTVGGYVESDFWNNVIGAGYHYTVSDNKKNESNAHHQLFVSYGYRLPVPGLMLSAIYGFARASLEDTDAKTSWENDMSSFRVRLRYDMQ